MTPTQDPDRRSAARRRPPGRRPISPVWFGVGLLALFLLINLASGAFKEGKPLEYSEFKSLLAQGRVAEVVVSEDSIRGKYQDGEGNNQAFTTTRL
jgi:hypothetical protein